MGYGIYVATAGAVARNNQIDVEANNIANASTTGYRRQRVTFQEVLKEEGAQLRNMVASTGNHLDQSSGSLEQTGSPLDLALSGQGFFALEERGQIVLKRSLAARVLTDGSLVDTQGRPLQSTSGRPLRIDPELEVSIDRDGFLSQDDRRIGRLRVVSTPRPEQLEPAGDGAYRTNEASGRVFDIEGEVLQGSLERSNVKPVSSMVQLISLERDYQSLMKAITAYRDADDQLLSSARR